MPPVKETLHNKIQKLRPQEKYSVLIFFYLQNALFKIKSIN